MSHGVYRYGSLSGGGDPQPPSRQHYYHYGATPGETASQATRGGPGANVDADYAGRLPRLYGGARPWVSTPASGFAEGLNANDHAYGSTGEPVRIGGFAATVRGPTAGVSVLGSRGTAVAPGNFFSRRYDALSAASPYAENRRMEAAPREPLSSAYPYRPAGIAEQLRPHSAEAGVTNGYAHLRQPAQPYVPSPPSGSDAAGGTEGDLVSTPTVLGIGGAVGAREAVESEPQRDPYDVAGEKDTAVAVANEPESQVLERVVAQQAELVDNIRERLRAIQARKQAMQEQLTKVREQEAEEMRCAAETRGRLEEARAQCQEQLEYLQAQLDDVRAQREALSQDYAARDAERRVAAQRAVEEKEEVTRIRRRLEELQRDMQDRLAAEESRYRARLENAKAASAQTERSARWLTEVESRLAAAVPAPSPSSGASGDRP